MMSTFSEQPPLSNLLASELKGNSTSKVWGEVLKLSIQPGICNLGQGFPDYPGCTPAREAAVRVLTEPDMASLNQYSAPAGLGALKDAVCAYYNRQYNLEEGKDARSITQDNILVTVGATEALYIGIKTLAGPGDEVIMFHPGFPWYAKATRLVGATPVQLELKGPGFTPDMAEVERAITPRTRVLLLNTPHNPCGHCFTKEELGEFARLAHKHNLAVLSDEVYENVTFGTNRHLRIADESGMFERTITIYSASKLFSLTGWRLGWAIGPSSLLSGLGMLHSATTYCGPTPLQYGLAEAFAIEDGTFEGIPKLIEGNAGILADALREKGLVVTVPEGGHFLVADTSPLGMNGLEFTKYLLAEAKVGVVPGLVFYFPEEGRGDLDKPLIRFAICKKRETIEEAARRIRAMKRPTASSLP